VRGGDGGPENKEQAQTDGGGEAEAAMQRAGGAREARKPTSGGRDGDGSGSERRSGHGVNPND